MLAEHQQAIENAIRERLTYCPHDGHLTWNTPRRERFATLNAFTSWRTRFGGKVAGKTRDDGYIGVRVTVDGYSVVVLAHRAAWFLHYGHWPADQIDHINGNRADNRITNLREVTQHQNLLNARCHAQSKTGVPGVSWSAHAKRWLARINVNKRTKNLGYYLSFDDAVQARHAAEQAYGYFPDHGKRERPADATSRAYVATKEAQRVRHRTTRAANG